MINLLPLDAKNGVRREYWLRVVTVWLLLLSAALVIGSLLLWPAYVLINSQVKVYQASADTVSAEVANYEDVSTALVQANQQSAFIVAETQQEKFSDMITLFYAFESERVDISEIELRREGTEIDFATVQGIAQDRQALAQFRDELLADPAIQSVELPISNLARGEDIPFSILITLVVNNQDSV